MTTATEAPTENKAKLAALEEARERLAEAQQKRATLDEKARAWAQDVAQAQAEYERLARTEQEQFDNAGQPKPKTAAAKLKPKIDDAKTSRLPAMVAGADDRIAEREAEVRLIGKVNAITGGSWSICSTAAVLRSGRPTSDSSGRCIRRPRRRGRRVNEKRIRDAAVLGALHGIVFEDEVEKTDTPNFDGGPRGELPPRRVEPPWELSDLGPTWREYEIEDGARLFFGQLGER